jgi:YbgC/YbaW family acyl-CoA thioester hydrolase
MADSRNVIGVDSRKLVYEFAVQFCDIDGNGHVNNKHYCSYCDEATMRVFAAAGIDLLDMRAQGVGPVTRTAHYEYVGSLGFGDTGRVTTTVRFGSKIRAHFSHLIENARTGQAVCRAQSEGLWIRLDTGRPHRFEDEVYTRLLYGDGEASA